MFVKMGQLAQEVIEIDYLMLIFLYIKEKNNSILAENCTFLPILNTKETITLFFGCVVYNKPTY